jgi:hypothetical protein
LGIGCFLLKFRLPSENWLLLKHHQRNRTISADHTSGLSGEGEGKAKKKRGKKKGEEEEAAMAPKTKVDIECMSPNYKGHKS